MVRLAVSMTQESARRSLPLDGPASGLAFGNGERKLGLATRIRLCGVVGSSDDQWIRSEHPSQPDAEHLHGEALHQGRVRTRVLP